MRAIAFAVALVCCGSTNREAAAQGFWYVPPGYEYGYYYGLDLGNGVGFGYWAGIGIPVSPTVLNANTTPNAMPPLHQSGNTPAATSSGVITSVVKPILPKKGAKKKVFAKQMHGSKIPKSAPKSKPNQEIKGTHAGQPSSSPVAAGAPPPNTPMQ